MGIKTNYDCLCCGVNVTKINTRSKFCSIKCQQKHKWETETVPRIENGECTVNSKNILKKYLKEKNGETCSECGQNSLWHDKPLTLQLDHVDGNSDNNNISNLRLLCPNCHSQTDTYGSKGKGNRYKKITKRNNYLREYKNS